MFSSSVRRGALAITSTPIASVSVSAPRATTSKALSYRTHQRRLSSSKPSSPADGSRGIADRQTVPVASAKGKGESEKKQSSKRKAKNVATNSTVKGRHESMLHLPSVPSTQHISFKDLSASDFFSIYRPISLTRSFPPEVTNEAFAAMFTARPRANKASEVISVLTEHVNTLDKLNRASEHQNGNEARTEIQHLDTPEAPGSMDFPAHILSGKYQPFSPPPPPVPMNTPESLLAGAEAAEAELEPQHRTYTALLTIEESTDSHGEVTYSAHSSPLVAELPPANPPTKFLERMQIRQERYQEQRSEVNDMLAISVKRQRKLKMKKHKYKKLMRRTRNLRRKLDRN